MSTRKRNYSLAILGALVLLTFASSCRDDDPQFEIVIAGGRVIDPETRLDAVRHVGVRRGRIEAISEAPLTGERVIAAAGLVVAPGFIDLHAHGQDDSTYRLMVRDGVTSAFELEVGAADVAGWYREREGRQIVNYGVSVGHIPVRMAVMGDQGGFLPSGPGGHLPATDEQIGEMAARIEAGLAEGAVAVGFGLAYTPAASQEEFETMLRIAVRHKASAHIHVRGGVDGATEAIEAAARTGAPLHIVHANSSGGAETVEFLRRIEEARAVGRDVTTEAYPYEAGMTSIQSALFDDWESWDEEQFGIHQLVDTGEWLNRDSFARYRREGALVIIHSRTEQMTRDAIGHPLTMIASDGFMEDGRGHPRTAGTYARVLGKYVREEGLLTLMDALRKMTIDPARRLEARTPDMRRKGRLQEGADADIVVFDPSTVNDRATYAEPTLPSAGIPYVLVNGRLAVERGELVEDVRSGRSIRAPLSPTADR